MRSILSVLELPLGEICLCAESTLWIFEAATGWLDLGGDEWGEVEILQVLWNNICPDFLPLNNISSVLGMATSRAGSRSLVKTLVGLLGGESKLARSTSPRK